MPHNVKPMLATLTDKPFDQENWFFEIKWDGYRAVAEIEKGKVNLHSRNNLSFNKQFKPVADALEALNLNAVLDGEIVILDENGRSSFQSLQQYQKTGSGDLRFYVFDILWLEGYDLTSLPLVKRKQLLNEILPQSDTILYSDHVEEDGISFFRAAQTQGLEGIIAKEKTGNYTAGKRSKSWLKIKTHLRQEAVIAGYTDPKGGRKFMGSLVLGLYNDKKQLEYIGHSGGGFDQKSLKAIVEKLKPFKIEKPPLINIPKKWNVKWNWVEPKFVCEVVFTEWTEAGTMRHPIFVGLREDKNPKEVKREIPKHVMKADKKVVELYPEDKSPKKNIKEVKFGKHILKLSNLDKVYFPDDGYTKGDVIEYYKSISEYMLPYLKGRPQSLNRHPNGIYNGSFYQKNVRGLVPEWIPTYDHYSENSNDTTTYMICNDTPTLIYMANLGCIEINPWFSTVDSPENPDYMVIDLDPEDIGFEKVIETALAVKEVMDEGGIISYPKTSGATGIHIYVPLKAKYNYEISKEFGNLIAQIVHKRIPSFTSIERSPKKRQKKVYLDYLQNRRGQTLAAPYSLRPKPGATAACPLDWKEVKPGLQPTDFTIKNIVRRVKKKGDIFKPIFGKAVDIEKAVKKLSKLA